MSEQTTLRPAETERLTKRGLRLAQFTVVYNVAEGAIAITVGILLLAASVIIMPLLARAKRRVGLALGGDQLILADAAETRICVLLSISTLIGLGLYALVGWTWLDPVAGFVIAVFAIHEGREAWEGELVDDDDDDDD